MILKKLIDQSFEVQLQVNILWSLEFFSCGRTYLRFHKLLYIEEWDF